MSSKITEIIPEQGFEVVLSQLASIISIELTKQKELQGFSDEINVYNSRQTPFNQSEKLIINVKLDASNYSNTNQVGSEGGTLFNIDFSCNEKSTSEEKTGLLSTNKLNKFVGMVRYILTSPKWNGLGLDSGFVGGHYVNDINWFDDPNNQDGVFNTHARIVLNVRINEVQDGYNGVTLAGTDATLKINNTELGYRYEYNV